jgi:hypothetical protein
MFYFKLAEKGARDTWENPGEWDADTLIILFPGAWNMGTPYAMHPIIQP